MVHRQSSGFDLGRLVISSQARVAVPPSEVKTALRLHARNLSAFSRAPEERFRFLSAYRTSAHDSFWVISEADSSRTTVLMPGEFIG
jgi:hypothetical protein